MSKALLHRPSPRRRPPLHPALIVSLALAGCGAPDDPGAGSSSLVVCAAGPTVEGIDVSYYQGGIDWGQVKASGRGFAITRVGDGFFEDPTFATNWSAIKSVGMVRGAYQFFRPGKDPEAQADILIRKVGVLSSGDLPAVVDVEATDDQPVAVIADHVKRWAARVAAGTGRAPMVYTGKYFWNDNVKTTDLAGNPLWIAAWGPPCPDTPLPWSGWRMWQYSSSGSVPGIGGRVDLDRFNGSMGDLQDFAGGPEWAAKYVSQSWPLATMAMELRAGEAVAASIELRNTGRGTWDGRTRLGTTAPRDRASPFHDAATWLSANRAAAVSGTVAPGGTWRFTFSFRAPRQPGSYHEHFTLVQEGVAWFSDPGQGGPPDEQIEAWINVLPGPPETPDLAEAPDLAGAPGADGGADDGVTTPEVQPGCSCRIGGRRQAPPLETGAFALLVVVAGLRRRRRWPSPLLLFAAAALLLPGPAAGDNLADDGVPPSMVAFFLSSGPACPAGWVPAAEAQGRLVAGVTRSIDVGVQVGAPLADQEDRAHQHHYSGVGTLSDKAVAASDGTNRGGAQAGTVTWSGETTPAATGLPFMQLLACEKQ